MGSNDAELDNEASRPYQNEAALAAGVISGDQQAVLELVRTNTPWMLAVAKRISKDSAVAEDCVQEAYLKIFQNIGKFEERSSLRTWMHRIVVNQALMKLRSQKRTQTDSIDELLPKFDAKGCRVEALWQGMATPEEICENNSRREKVQKKISELPEDYRLVLQLRDIEEFSTRNVAELLGISEQNTKVRLHRARSALKKALEPLLKGEL